VLVAIAWMLRATGWLVRDWAPNSLADTGAAALGIGSDAVGLLGLAMVARAERKAVRIGARVLIASAFCVRVADLAHVYVEKAHFTVATWLYADLSMWRVMVEAGLPVVAFVGLGFAWFGWRASGLEARRRAPIQPVIPAIVVALLGVVHFAAFLHPLHAGIVPEINAIRTFAAFHGLRPPPSTTELTLEDRRTCARAGLLADPEPNPAARLPGIPTATDARHVVIVFVESLTAGFTSLHRGHGHHHGAAEHEEERDEKAEEHEEDEEEEAPDRTPELAKIAAKSLHVRGYTTQARPTHNALVASLCGQFPGSWPFDADAGRSPPQTTCLPAILAAKRAMQTTFIHASPNRFTATGRTMRAFGFKHVVDGGALFDELKAAGAGPVHLGPLGLHDAALYDRAIRTVQDADAKGQGAFVTVVTGDTHFPTQRPGDCSIAADARLSGPAADIDRAIRCSDAALGAFVRGLNTRGLLKKTLLVITADHPMPNVPGRNALLPEHDRGFFAELPLVISLPEQATGVLAVEAGQTSLPDTIVDLLGLATDGTVFAGRSLLRQPRPDAHGLFAFTDHRIAVVDHGKEHIRPLAEMRALCSDERAADTSFCALVRCINHIDGYWFGRHPL